MAEIPDIPNTPDPQDSAAMESLIEASVNPPDDLEIQSESGKESESTKKETTTTDEGKPDGGGTDESGREKTEQKVEEPKKDDGVVEPKTVDEKKKVSEEHGPDDFDKELEKFQLKTGASPKSQEGFKVIKDKAKEEHKAHLEYKQKFEETEKRLKDIEGKSITPELEKELNELRTFRSSIDIESDPVFTDKFVKGIETESNDAIGLLKSWGMPDSAAEFINKNGGVYNFRSSKSPMPNDPKFKNKDGSIMTHEQWWEDKIYKNMTSAQKEEFGDRMGNIRRLQREKQAAVKDAASHRETYLKSQKENAKKQEEEWKTRIEAQTPKSLARYGDIAKIKEIPADASPEMKAELTKHNERVKNAERVAVEFLGNISPETIADAATALAYASVSQDLLKEVQTKYDEAQKTIDELNKKLEGLKRAGKTSTTVSPTKVAPVVTTKDDEAAMIELVNQTP